MGILQTAGGEGQGALTSPRFCSTAHSPCNSGNFRKDLPDSLTNRWTRHVQVLVNLDVDRRDDLRIGTTGRPWTGGKMSRRVGRCDSSDLCMSTDSNSSRKERKSLNTGLSKGWPRPPPPEERSSFQAAFGQLLGECWNDPQTRPDCKTTPQR